MTHVDHTRMANAIRGLAMDAVEKANSGHPGLPMGMADVATVLFTQFLKFDAAGNAKIVEALKASDKKDHLRVDVKGDVQGDTLKVTSVKLP